MENRLINTQPVNRGSPGRLLPAIPPQVINLTSQTKGPMQQSTSEQQKGTNTSHTDTSNEHMGSQSASDGIDDTGNVVSNTPNPKPFPLLL